jgi:hypothetical protein
MHPSLREERVRRGLGRGEIQENQAPLSDPQQAASLTRSAGGPRPRQTARAPAPPKRSGTLGTTSLPAGRDAVLSVPSFYFATRERTTPPPSSEEREKTASVLDANFLNLMAVEVRVRSSLFPTYTDPANGPRLGEKSPRTESARMTFPVVNFRWSNFDIPSFGCLC